MKIKRKLLFVECLLYVEHHTVHFININLFKTSHRKYYHLCLTDEKADAQ